MHGDECKMLGPLHIIQGLNAIYNIGSELHVNIVNIFSYTLSMVNEWPTYKFEVYIS